MTDEQNKLATTNKVVIGGVKTGLAKRIAEKSQNANGQATVDYSTFPNRLGLVMDDSGSMYEDMDKAHEAIEIFIKNCNASDTAIALYPLNVDAKSLSNNYAAVGLYAMSIQATGGTPLYQVLEKMLDSENLTRAVAFSDGGPNGGTYEYNPLHKLLCEKYRSKKVPIDTIFIGHAGDSGYETMKRIAEDTGGIFLHFTDASVLAKNLKYLTPAYRALLSDDNTRKQVESGL